jgi:endonuclease-3 related protein
VEELNELSGARLRVIGTVASPLIKPGLRCAAGVISEIKVDPALAEALDNLDEFSHLLVLYWMHRAGKDWPLKVHPKGMIDVAAVGLFASRSPNRPNPIGVSLVRLLGRSGNSLRVEGLDAIDGTPVLDIKPFIPWNDAADRAGVPPWVVRFHGLEERLREVYRRLLNVYGPQHWWPAETPFEVMVGAILTQSAAWGNVEKAIASLKSAGALSPEVLRRLPQEELARLIHASGYYNAKAVKLKALAEWLKEACGDDLTRLSTADTETLRTGLLGVHGVGEETADSILLYAVGKPVFVIDAYTRRILDRLGIGSAARSYAGYQRLFVEVLPAEVPLFNEYHALFVALGKFACRRRPLCSKCPLADICPSRIV